MVATLRPWEETWHLEHAVVCDHNDRPVFSHGDVCTTEEKRAQLRLAAAAPAMARTLMVLAGMGRDKYCNGCGDTEKRGHLPTCSLMAILFEAGVGELTPGKRVSVPLCLVQK